MKKFKIIYVLFAMTLIVFSGSCFGMSKFRDTVRVEGIVEFYGSGPFSRLGLKTQDGTLYFLTAEKDLQKELNELSGRKIAVDGILTGEQAPAEIPGAIVIKVRRYKK